MTVKEYFEDRSGTGVLATADADGKVDAAIYSTPHVLADGTVAFIMRERLTHQNLQSNPYATYLFLEERPGHKGLRLFLNKIKEDSDPDLIAGMTRRHLSPEQDKQRGPQYLVYFSIEKILPLNGGREAPLTIGEEVGNTSWPVPCRGQTPCKYNTNLILYYF